MTATRVVIVADDPLARAGLATLLADQPELVVAGRVSGSDDLAAANEIYRPDVLLWDMGWRPEAALARLAETPQGVPVLTLVDEGSDAAQAWRAGARAILRRDSPPARISAALAAVAQNLQVMDPAYIDILQKTAPSPPSGLQTPGDEAPLVEDLTPRELEVLRLLAEGLPNKSIAHRLDISEHTVKFHVNALLGKLGVASRTEAVVRATRLGLIFL